LITAPGVPRPVAAHAAVTRASHLRQMGGHAAARAYDALGLRMASAAVPGVDLSPDPDGVGPAAARVDALVGLAADAVGLGDAATARRLLEAAGDAARTVPSWRPGVRLGWVRAELALVEGRPDAAVAPAADALSAARAGGSARHVLKSRIVLAVVRAAAGDVSAASAVADLDGAAADCARRGFLPLVWPAALAAADLEAAAGRRGGGERGDGDDAGNDAPAGSAAGALADRVSDAKRRRHAASRALSALYSRADPTGKRQMGESRWLPAESTLL
jgi:hypothetical protein